MSQFHLCEYTFDGSDYWHLNTYELDETSLKSLEGPPVKAYKLLSFESGYFWGEQEDANLLHTLVVVDVSFSILMTWCFE